MQEISYTDKTPKILYQDRHILVGFKPAGMATQGRNIGRMDFQSYLKNYLSQTHALKTEPFLGLVHRLDQPVCGLLVFGLTKESTAALNRQLQSGQFQKYYRVLTLHPPKQSMNQLTHYLAKDKQKNLSFVTTPSTPQAKLAKLSYQEVQTPPFIFDELRHSLKGHELDIQLETGRHHQIRVQLSEACLPILGDQKYNPSCTKNIEALCLCAYRLAFLHPKTKKPLCFSMLS